MTDESYTNLDRARDAVANSDWMDTGRVDPWTIAAGYAFFERVIRQVKFEAWEKGRASLGIMLPTNPPQHPRNPYL